MTRQQISNDVSVVVAQSVAELTPFLTDLEELASAAAEPNLFYEPWMLLPAMRWLARDTDLRLALIFIRGRGRAPEGQLCGFFPLEIRNRYNHFPVKTARLWRHEFCYLCTPLLRQGNERETLAAFFDWSATQSKSWRIVEFGWNSGSGVLHELLVESTSPNRRSGLVDIRFTRPFLRCAVSADMYLKHAVSAKHLKDIEKKERRLRQLGDVDYAVAVSAEQAREWVDEFIKLEAIGWKAKRGEPISANPIHRDFFRDAMNSAWQAGRLELIALRLNSKPIAIKINLLCRGASFAIRITFDESYSAYSPGLLLEIENIRRIHRDSRTYWMDSCADQHSQIFNRIWSEKRIIETVLVSNASRVGDAWIGLIPLGHFLRQTFFGRTSRHGATADGTIHRRGASPAKEIHPLETPGITKVCEHETLSQK